MLTTNLPAQRVCSGHPPPTTERLLRKASSRYATSGHGNCLESDALASSLGRTHARMATNRPRAAGDRRQSTGTRPAGTHVLSFPCCLTDEGWINSRTGARLAVSPLRWKTYEPARSEQRRCTQRHRVRHVRLRAFPVRFVARFTDGTSAIFPVERYVLQQLGEAAGYAVLRSGQRAGLLPKKPVLRVSQAPERTRVSIARQ